MSNKITFTVFPAIDLRQGQVVRLKEGDPDRQTAYSNDPRGTARRWIDAGTRWLHVVNLDGAFNQPDTSNLQALRAILAEADTAGVFVQFGGGLRSMESIRKVLEMGASRVILGTAAVENPHVLTEALAHWGPDRIGISLDARDGRVQVRGWKAATPLLAKDLARAWRDAGLSWLVFTDISRDGLQTGINLDATVELAQTSGLRVIASGGVSRIEDVLRARESGIAGVIVGRALYEDAVDPDQLFQLNTSG